MEWGTAPQELTERGNYDSDLIFFRFKLFNIKCQLFKKKNSWTNAKKRKYKRYKCSCLKRKKNGWVYTKQFQRGSQSQSWVHLVSATVVGGTRNVLVRGYISPSPPPKKNCINLIFRQVLSKMNCLSCRRSSLAEHVHVGYEVSVHLGNWGKGQSHTGSLSCAFASFAGTASVFTSCCPSTVSGDPSVVTLMGVSLALITLVLKHLCSRSAIYTWSRVVVGIPFDGNCRHFLVVLKLHEPL